MLHVELYVHAYIGRKEKELNRVDEAPFFFAPPVIITGALSLLPRRGLQWSISFVRRPVAWSTCKVGGYLKAIAWLTQRASKGSARVKEEEKDERSKTENKGNGQPPSRCTGGWLASRNCFSTWICKARVNNLRFSLFSSSCFEERKIERIKEITICAK